MYLLNAFFLIRPDFFLFVKCCLVEIAIYISMLLVHDAYWFKVTICKLIGQVGHNL